MGIHMICMCNLVEGFCDHADLGRSTPGAVLGSEGIHTLHRFSTLSTSCNVRYSSNAAISSMLERGSHVRSPNPHLMQNHKQLSTSHVWVTISLTWYSLLGWSVTPVTHQPCTAASDPMRVQPHHMGTNGQTDHGRPTPGMDC